MENTGLSGQIPDIWQPYIHVRKCVETKISSNYNQFNAKLKFYVLDSITHKLPACSLEASLIHIPRNINLADPKFYEQRDIDALVGAEIFFKLLCQGQIETNIPGVILQKSLLGWIVSGKLPQNYLQSVFCHHISMNEIDNSIKQFWEIEQTSASPKILSNEERDCDIHFTQTVRREVDGRFVVSLPWKGDPLMLGQSFSTAKRCLFSLENRLAKNAEIKKEYDSFMTEYINLGHMTKVADNIDVFGPGYFLPHHAVFFFYKILKLILCYLHIKLFFTQISYYDTGFEYKSTFDIHMTKYFSFRWPRVNFSYIVLVLRIEVNL